MTQKSKSRSPKGRPCNTPDNVRTCGTLWLQRSSTRKNGKVYTYIYWQARIMIQGKIYRHVSKYRDNCEEWLRAVKRGEIRLGNKKFRE